MKQYIFYSLIFLSALTSCDKKIKPSKGGIDLISNVYINASKNLDNTQSFHISKINYANDSIIELIPNVSNPMITESLNPFLINIKKEQFSVKIISLIIIIEGI